MPKRLKHASRITEGDRVFNLDGDPTRHGTVIFVQRTGSISNGNIAMATVDWYPPPAHPTWPPARLRRTVTRLGKV